MAGGQRIFAARQNSEPQALTLETCCFQGLQARAGQSPKLSEDNCSAEMSGGAIYVHYEGVQLKGSMSFRQCRRPAALSNCS